MKNVFYTIAVVMFGLLIYSHFSSKIEKESYISIIYELNQKSDSIQLVNNNYEKRIESLFEKEKENQEIIAEKQNTITGLSKELQSLQDQYSDIEQEIKDTPVEKSYRFLTQIAYPFEGERLFSFNKPQVRGLHQTYLERNSLLNQNSLLKTKSQEFSNIIDVQFRQIEVVSERWELCDSIRLNQGKQLMIKDDVIEIYDVELIDCKDKNKKIKIITVASAIIAFLIGAAAF